jgi:holo-[acyl-carrier protein] synthase
MIKGIGVDIVDIKRIELKIATKVLSKDENDLFLSMSESRKKEFLSGRFAIKEALFKAGVKEPFAMLNIKYNDDNSIYLEGYSNVKVSISHEKGYAIGFAIKEA